MQYLGGSFAPPLDDEKLSSYRSLIDALPPGPIKDAMNTLMNLVSVWWDLPESTLPARSTPFFSIRPDGSNVPIVQRSLEGAHKDLLDPLIPWAHEIESLKTLFNRIDPVESKPLRDAAHHLLWFAIELDKGREPITKDKTQ